MRPQSSTAQLFARRDLHSRVVGRLVRWGGGSPRWRLETLAFLAETESSAVEILAAAVRAVEDRQFRRLLDKHVLDEARHARLFGERCDVVAANLGLPRPRPRTPANSERAGFDVLGLFAFLEVTELRGFQVLSAYRKIFADDPATLAVIDSVLADEHFHVAYSHLQLERWLKKGLANEVAAARREARRIDSLALRQQVASFALSLLRRASDALVRRARKSRVDADSRLSA